MKALVADRYGGPAVLSVRDLPTPKPRSGEVLVRVHATSINDWDLENLRGRQLIVRMTLGMRRPKVHVLGCDMAGRVDAVGDGVDDLQPGDDVYADLCMNGFGAFAEYVRAPARIFARKPADMTFEQAAAIPQAGMLAWQGLIDFGRLRDGQKVLLNGAGGGVGTIGVQIAKLYGAEVTVVDKASKLEMLRSLGADHALDYEVQDFTRGYERYDLILDTKTTRSPFAYARVLNPNGIYATVGGRMRRVLQAYTLGPLLSRYGSRHMRVVPLKPNKDLARMNELFEAGNMRPVLDPRIFGFDELPDALEYYGSGDQLGKVIVRMV